MSVVALSIIIPTALILISLIVSAAGEQQVPLLGNVGPLWSADHRHIAGVFVYLSKKEWSFYSPAHLHLFNQSSSTYGRTPLSTRHMLLVLLRLWLSMFVRFPTFLRVTMCSDGAGTVKSQHKWGQWRLTHIQKNYTQIVDDDGSGCDVITSIHRSGRAAQTSPSPPNLTTRFWQCTDYY